MSAETLNAEVAARAARDYAARWMALYWRQRGIDELSLATRALEQREIDRLAEELVTMAKTETPNAKKTEGGAQ